MNVCELLQSLPSAMILEYERDGVAVRRDVSMASSDQATCIIVH